MPIAIFAMLVFAILTWLGAGAVETVMRDFAGEIGMRSWLFIAVPGLFAALYSLLLYQQAAQRVRTVRESLSRALLVGIATWLTITGLISFMWCPGYRALRCTSDVMLVTGIVGGGPLLAAALVSGVIIGLVLKRRVSWLAYEAPLPRRIADGTNAE